MAKGKKPEPKDVQKNGSDQDRTVIVIDEPVKIEWHKNWLKIFKVRKKSTKPTTNNQAKRDQLEAKRLAKEAKILYQKQKKEQKVLKRTRDLELKENLNPANAKLASKTISQETRKKIRVKKSKEKNEKFDFKQAAREFPVKMIKEVNKIKWSGAENLTKKYVTVIIFMAVFAMLFYFIDWGLQALFALMKVI